MALRESKWENSLIATDLSHCCLPGHHQEFRPSRISLFRILADSSIHPSASTVRPRPRVVVYVEARTSTFEISWSLAILLQPVEIVIGHQAGAPLRKNVGKFPLLRLGSHIIAASIKAARKTEMSGHRAQANKGCGGQCHQFPGTGRCSAHWRHFVSRRDSAGAYRTFHRQELDQPRAPAHTCLSYIPWRTARTNASRMHRRGKVLAGIC
jgi:hypothetical protein